MATPKYQYLGACIIYYRYSRVNLIICMYKCIEKRPIRPDSMVYSGVVALCSVCLFCNGL